MAVYGYIRVSTDRQAEEGESLETQQNAVAGVALQHGWTLAQVFVERGSSGTVPLRERPEGRRLLALVRPGDTVVAPKLDRLFRSSLDALTVAEDFRARGINLFLPDTGGMVTNGAGAMFFTILSAVAQFERERIAERIRDVKADQRHRGRYLGGKVPFGWHVGPAGELVEDPVQQAAIRRMRELRVAGRPLRAIVAELETTGHRLSVSGVRKILEAAEHRQEAA